ncbi:MAG: CDGSH iron-sulfur domain-containing protein [Acidimicrobiia bacterium]|nr:CDGSH iron-sulfur domain-containing protein [Acidimicrobiia bacterium]MDH5237123.1 CDGSH iron-sulfur domain-containing protein [Acidimicrobiia bacterium]
MAIEDAPSIRIRRSGPLVVSGPIPIRRKTIVKSEHGEPLAYRSSEPLEGFNARKGNAALCRCGGSGNKPFCDGTHMGVDWDHHETASGTYAERSRELGGSRISVHDDRSICVHAGFCGTRVSSVWKLVDDTDDSIVRLQVINMVEKCPSGALTFRLPDDENDVEPGLPMEIGVLDDGPLWVQGGVPVQCSDGTTLETRNRVTLCRCGASGNKPLCDGSHVAAGFGDSG